MTNKRSPRRARFGALSRVLVKLFGGERAACYYIGGAQTLPPPLTPEEEQDALARLLAGDGNMRDLLIERNLRLVVYIAKKFEGSGVGLEDLISIGTIGLIKAVNTFHSDRNIKLATYASRCVENEILMHLRKISGMRAEVSIDEPLNTDRDGNELLLSDILSGGEEDSALATLERAEESARVAHAIAGLPERDRDIIKLRYGLGVARVYTQKEVADKMGISQSYISRLEKKILDHLRELIEV